MAIATVNRLSVSSIPYTFKQVCKMIDNNGISFDNVVQRSYTWEKARRSEFIWSIIMNYPIPPIYAGRDINGDNKTLDIMDGQQRLTTVHMFINDEFALTELKSIPCEDGDIDISGLKFSELDEDLQDLIKDRTVTFYYYDNIEQSQKAEMFKRLNNGKALTAKNKLLASCSDLEGLLDIGNADLFNDMLTKKARDNKNQVTLIAKTYLMLYQDVKDISFEGKVLNPFVETLSINKDERKEMDEVFDFAMNIHTYLTDKDKKVAKKYYTETHFISLIPFIVQAMADELTEEQIGNWLLDFFAPANETSVSREYNEASGKGSAKNNAILSRHKALEESYQGFFA